MSRLRWLALFALAVSGCGRGDVELPPPELPLGPNEGVMAVSVSPNGQVISVGDTLRFHGTPNGRGLTGVTWSIDTPSVASVDAEGLVRGIQPGMTGVIACAKERPAVCGVAILRIQ